MKYVEWQGLIKETWPFQVPEVLINKPCNVKWIGEQADENHPCQPDLFKFLQTKPNLRFNMVWTSQRKKNIHTAQELLQIAEDDDQVIERMNWGSSSSSSEVRDPVRFKIEIEIEWGSSSSEWKDEVRLRSKMKWGSRRKVLGSQSLWVPPCSFQAGTYLAL